MPTLNRARLARTMAQLMGKYPTKAVAETLAATLADYNKLRDSDLLLRDIAVELFESQGILTATVLSPHPLPKASLNVITKLLKDHYHAKEVVLEEKTMPEILGGFKVVTPFGDIDGSIQQQLNQLKTKLL